jgi:hypothetical protein
MSTAPIDEAVIRARFAKEELWQSGDWGTREYAASLLTILDAARRERDETRGEAGRTNSMSASTSERRQVTCVRIASWRF